MVILCSFTRYKHTVHVYEYVQRYRTQTINRMNYMYVHVSLLELYIHVISTQHIVKQFIHIIVNY